MVAVRTNESNEVQPNESNEVQPYKRVCFKLESIDSNILQSVLFKVLRGACLLSWNIGQCRRKWEVDAILEPQLQSGIKQIWKLYLNLCSRKWLNSSQSRTIKLIPFHDESLYHIETSPLICTRNQWTGFYMIGTSVMKELN